MHSIEFPDRDSSALPVSGQRIKSVVDCDRTHRVTRFLNHHRPRMGKNSGMNRYPIPNWDHTVWSGKTSGAIMLAVPTTTTPSNSNESDHSAILRAAGFFPRARDTVAIA